MRREGKTRTLSVQLMIPMMLFAIIPMLVFSIVLNAMINTANQESGMRVMENASITVAERMMGVYNNGKEIARTLSMSPSIRKTCRELVGGTTIARELDAYRLLNDLLNASVMNRDFFSVRVYLPEAVLITHENVAFYGLESLPLDEIPEDMRKSRVKMGWSTWYLSPIGIGKRNEWVRTYWIKTNLTGIKSTSYYIAVDVSLACFVPIVREVSGFSGKYLVLNKHGVTMTGYGHIQGTGFHTVETAFDNETTIVIMADLSQFSTDAGQSMTLLVVMVLVCIPLVVLVSYLAFRKVCKSLRKLAEANHGIALGQYKQITVDASSYEVRKIQETYNVMTEQIKDLIQNVYKVQLEKEKAQLVCLMEQFKPHFLYNTLDSAKWMAIHENDKKTAAFIDKLARYFRTGLGNGTELVKLETELEHIRLYMDLMNMRYSNSIGFTIDAEPETLHIPVVRLMLQPLVENAVEHGVSGIKEEMRSVQIRARKEDSTLVVSVEDNGVGLSDEELRALNSGQNKGIGVANVLKRLNLIYGESSSIHFERREPRGTRVTVRLDQLSY